MFVHLFFSHKLWFLCIGYCQLKEEEIVDDALFDFFSKEILILFVLFPSVVWFIFLFFCLHSLNFCIMFFWQAIEILKRDFVNFCRDSNIGTKLILDEFHFNFNICFFLCVYLIHFTFLYTHPEKRQKPMEFERIRSLYIQ